MNERGGSSGLIKRSAPAVVAVGGAGALIAAPAVIQMVTSVHPGVDLKEAVIGLGAGTIVVGMMEGGFDAPHGPTGRTAIAMATSAVGAGVGAEMIASLAHAHAGAGPAVIGVLGGAGASFLGSMVYNGSDAADAAPGHAHALRNVTVATASIAGAGVLAATASAVFGLHLPDLAAIDTIASVGVGASVAPATMAALRRGRVRRDAPVVLSE